MAEVTPVTLVTLLCDRVAEVTPVTLVTLLCDPAAEVTLVTLVTLPRDRMAEVTLPRNRAAKVTPVTRAIASKCQAMTDQPLFACHSEPGLRSVILTRPYGR